MYSIALNIKLKKRTYKFIYLYTNISKRIYKKLLSLVASRENGIAGEQERGNLLFFIYHFIPSEFYSICMVLKLNDIIIF